MSKELSIALGNRVEFHSLISIENSSLSSERFVVTPIYSRLFLKAVDSHKIAHHSPSAALPDAFHVSRHVIEFDQARHPRISPLPSFPVPQKIVHPEQLNNNKKGSYETRSNESRHIQLSEYALIDIATTFFHLCKLQP